MIEPKYWERIRSADGVVPTDLPLPRLVAELEDMLALPDAHTRDEIAYEVLGDWVLQGVCDADLVGLGDRLVAAIGRGLGEVGTDSVFGRSFAALVLGLVIERDIVAEIVDGETMTQWLNDFLDWFAAERDLRGVTDPRRGVAHVPAHAADVIATLARSRHVDAAAAGRLLDAIPARLVDTAGTTLLLSEDERLAYASMALLHRGDLPAGRLERAIAPLRELSTVRHRHDLDPRAHARLNAINYLRALYLQLDLGVKAMPWYAADDHFAAPPPDRRAMCAVIADVLRPFSYWYADAGTPD
ncbi:DUF2785 domain-containing protein [Micromonospora sp. NBC_00898]|uniref:DUF2785 domain-containing protein n=1 Tax=Micromonospora sp. NBC_00898 TaxID=2975981 RepID=UPI00386AF3EA|nr:DUF2785 domain-containing protein [Micromonospora sp. NBC_00898]